MTGHLFGDRYQVGDTLGFGGMSEVHRGRDLRLGRDVAIKVLRADLARDPSFQTRFRREAQNAASLNHPAIVAVYDTGETPGETGPIPYIVMEFVDGETLRDLLKREGPLAPKRAMEIVADVCAALDFSHRHGIVHRDIKPANVMLTRAGAVKVMDFGIARAVADGQSSMTATAAVIGTAQYLSPEQARGEAVDARSDVYATGCVLFELITGSPPFTGDSPVAVAYQHVREDPKAPSEVKPGLPKELDAIVLKALNKNPLNRYQTAAEMRSDLVRALSGQAVHATPVMTDEERTQLLRPGPQRVGAGAGTPPLLAPPRRTLPDEMWEDETPTRSKKRVWGFIGVGVLCAALLAGAIIFTLKIANGGKVAATVVVPNVVGQTQSSAVATLQNMGLAVGSITQVASQDNDKGNVVAQNPSDKSQVAQGTKVDLQIGKGVDKATVPNLTGMKQADATKSLTDLGLTVKVANKASTADEKGNVIDQNPKSGVQVDPASTVTIVVGSGTKSQKIPTDLVGKSFDEAKAELGALNLQAIEIPQDSDQPLNQVLSLTSATPAGKIVDENTVVQINTSKFNQFTMPDLTGQTSEAAAITLKSAGYNGTPVQAGVPVTQPALINVVTQGTGDGISPVCAVGQDPKAGTKLYKIGGPTVTMCIGRAALFTVPNVTGATKADAVAAIQSSGFTVSPRFNVVGQAPTPDQADKVVSTDPISGSQAQYDTQITINVYAPPAPSSSSSPPTSGSTAPSGPNGTPGQGGGVNPPGTTASTPGAGG